LNQLAVLILEDLAGQPLQNPAGSSQQHRDATIGAGNIGSLDDTDASWQIIRHGSGHAATLATGTGVYSSTAGPGAIVKLACSELLAPTRPHPRHPQKWVPGRLQPPDAEFVEQKGIVENVETGIAHLGAQGKRPGRARINGATEDAIRASLAAGHGIRTTAHEAGVGLWLCSGSRPSARTRNC
jgi:hypothetical protein